MWYFIPIWIFLGKRTDICKLCGCYGWWMVEHCLVSSIMSIVSWYFIPIYSLVKGQISASCVYVRDGGWWDIVLLRCLLQFGSDDSVLIIDAASAEYNHLFLRCLLQFGCDGSHLSLDNWCSFCRILPSIAIILLLPKLPSHFHTNSFHLNYWHATVSNEFTMKRYCSKYYLLYFFRLMPSKYIFRNVLHFPDTPGNTCLNVPL